MVRNFAILGIVIAASLLGCSGSSSSTSCESCTKLAACCAAEVAIDGGLPGARCTSQADVTDNNAESSSCNSDPSIVQGDANSTCAGYLASQASLSGSPSACQ